MSTMGEAPSNKTKPEPHSTVPGVEIDKSAIKPGPAADNPKAAVPKPEPTDKDKAPEPPVDNARR